MMETAYFFDYMINFMGVCVCVYECERVTECVRHWVSEYMDPLNWVWESMGYKQDVPREWSILTIVTITKKVQFSVEWVNGGLP